MAEAGKKQNATAISWDTLLGTNISPKNGIFEDDFPFPKVGYVSSLEGKLLLASFSCKIDQLCYHDLFFLGSWLRIDGPASGKQRFISFWWSIQGGPEIRTQHFCCWFGHTLLRQGFFHFSDSKHLKKWCGLGSCLWIHATCSEMELQRIPTQIHVDQFKAYESKPLNFFGRSVAVLSCVAYHFTPKIDDWRVRIAFSKKGLVLLVCHYKKTQAMSSSCCKTQHG